jgi:mannose-6-phosphate isomerase-like protein (cupin superfamily)
MVHQSINFAEKLELFAEQWSPKVIAELNDYQLKLVKIQGEFIWHTHQNTDELFLVLSGEMKILLRDGHVALKAGEMFVVKNGVEHKPVAIEECHVLLIEPRGVTNTGDSQEQKAADQNVWV